MTGNETARPMGQVIWIDEGRIREHLGEIVRGTVEEALNATLDAEAEQLCSANRYERSEGSKDTRAGSCWKSLETRAGKVSLQVPKLRRQPFETDIIEPGRGHHRGSVEHACQPEHAVEPEQEDLCQDQRMAAPLDQRRPPVCFSRRFCHEALSGRCSAQRVAAGGHPCDQRELSRDPGYHGRPQRGQIRLVGFSTPTDGLWPFWHSSGCFRRI